MNALNHFIPLFFYCQESYPEDLTDDATENDNNNGYHYIIVNDPYTSETVAQSDGIGLPILGLVVFLVTMLVVVLIKKKRDNRDTRKNYYVSGNETKKQNENIVEKESLLISKKQDCNMTSSDTNSISNPVETKILCRECYAQVPENAKFCPFCGKPVNSTLTMVINDPDKWKSYFREILQKYFPEYTFKEDYPVDELVGDTYDVFKLYQDRPNQVYKAEWGKPYDFVLYLEGKVVGVIMIGWDHSHNKNVKYLISKMFAKKIKVPYIGFYTNFPNKEDYVCNRIKSIIK